MEAVHEWAQTQSLVTLKLNSLSTRTFSPRAMTLTLVFMMIVKGQLLKILSANASLEKAAHHAVKSISVELIINYRSSCLELSKDELDLVILGQVHSHYVPLTSDSDCRKTSYSSRYFFHNKPICLKPSFLFMQ